MNAISEDKYADSYVAAVVDGDTQTTNEPVIVATEPEQQEVQQDVIFQNAEGQQVISADQMKKDVEAKKKAEEDAAKAAAAQAAKSAKTVETPKVTAKPITVKEDIKAAAPSQEGVTCPDNACPYQGKCVVKPEQAFCVANTPAHAWTCKE